MRLVLTNPEVLAVPTAVDVEIRKVIINHAEREIRVEYTFKTGDGDEIPEHNTNTTYRYWICRDSTDPPSTDYSDIVNFEIRPQDVGKKIGKGLWALTWNKMKADILSEGNDGMEQE